MGHNQSFPHPERGRTCYEALKLDLEKAYDHLEWPFIKESLEFSHVLPNLITLIMNIISSTCFHIKWNGAPLPEVIQSRGVHQGDPLSPYLSILCLERLSILLEKAIWDRLIHLIGFRGQLRISHLFFAYDIFLFTKAKAKDCQRISQQLDKLSCQFLWGGYKPAPMLSYS